MNCDSPSQVTLGTGASSVNDEIQKVPRTDVIQNTALITAVSKGDEQDVKRLLEQGANPNSTSRPYFERHPLSEAAIAGHMNIVRLLLEHGADPARTSVEIFKCLTGQPIDPRRRRHIFKLLVQSGVWFQNLGEVAAEDLWLLAKHLLDCGVHPDTLLHQALGLGQADHALLEVLAEADANVKLVCRQALAQCDRDAYPKMFHKVKALLMTFSGPINDNVSRIREAKSAAEIHDNDRVLNLVREGVDPSWLLQISLQTVNAKLSRSLLDRGADPRFISLELDLEDDIGSEGFGTLLMDTIELDHFTLLQLLFDQGADPNYLGHTAMETPLMKACRHNHMRIAELLLANGARADMEIVSGGRRSTALEKALEAALDDDNPEIIFLLLGQDTECRFHSYLHYSLYVDMFDIESEDELARKAQHACKELVRKRLRSEFGDPETALVRACMEDNTSQVQRLLQKASGPGTIISRLRPIDMDAVHQDTTALAQAVTNQNLQVAKLLLHHGADVNKLLPIGTPLSIAAQTGCEVIIRLLLRSGADLHLAAFKLRSHPPGSSGQGAFKTLNECYLRYRREIAAKSKPESLLVRGNFTKGYDNIMRAASYDFDDRGRWRNTEALNPEVSTNLSGPWAVGLDMTWRKAWQTGVRTLRGLCDGRLPRSLNETIMFLGVAKAMSEVENEECEFFEDLNRWQVLYATRQDALENFRAAVHAIWGMKVEYHPSRPSSSVTNLVDLQDMAISLFSRFNNTIGQESTSYYGFLAVKARWRQRHLHNNANALIEEPDPNPATLTAGRTSELLDHYHRGSEATDELESSSPKAEVLDDPSNSNPPNPDVGRILNIIMAGAIFALVMAFLLGMKLLH